MNFLEKYAICRAESDKSRALSRLYLAKNNHILMGEYDKIAEALTDIANMALEAEKELEKRKFE